MPRSKRWNTDAHLVGENSWAVSWCAVAARGTKFWKLLQCSRFQYLVPVSPMPPLRRPVRLWEPPLDFSYLIPNDLSDFQQRCRLLIHSW